jgi:hypothetical protein
MAGRLNKKKINAKNVICGIFEIQTGDGNPKTDGSLAAGPGAFQPTEMFSSSLLNELNCCCYLKICSDSVVVEYYYYYYYYSEDKTFA